MQFLMDIMEQKRKTTIEDLLLLLLRILLLLLLALAVARPILDSGAMTDLIGSDADVVIVLDNSYSMGTTIGGQSRWDKAKEFAVNIIDTQSSGSGFCLLLASELPDQIIAEFSNDPSLVMETTRGLSLSSLGSNWSSSLAAITGLLKTSNKSLKKVYIISDYQKEDWYNLDQSVLKMVKDLHNDVQLTMVNVGDNTQDNLTAIRLRLSAGAMRTGTKAVFAADIQNSGTEMAEDVPVDFLVDNVVIESSTISIGPEQTGTVRFKYEALEDGLHEASVRIRSDTLENDNKAHLPFRVVESISALSVSEGENNFGFLPTQFIELALNPFNEGSESDEAIYNFQNISISDIAGEDLSQYDFVCISGVNAVSSVEANILEEYVQMGGGVLMFLGSETDIPTYNSNLYDDGEGLFSWPLAVDKITEENEKDAMRLRAYNLSHPLWHGLIDRQNDYLKNVKIYSTFTFLKGSEERAIPLADVITSGENASANDNTSSNNPVIVDFSKGRGHCIVVCSSSDLSMNDFISHPVFVGFINQSVKYSKSFRAGDSVVTAGSTATRFVDFQSSQANFVCSSPSGEQSILPVTVSDNEYKIELSELREAGVYQLVNQNDASEMSYIGVNVSANEGKISSLESAAVAALFNETEVNVINASTTSEIENATAGGGGGAELAALLLFLVLLCWIGENYLAHRISKR